MDIVKLLKNQNITGYNINRDERTLILNKPTSFSAQMVDGWTIECQDNCNLILGDSNKVFARDNCNIMCGSFNMVVVGDNCIVNCWDNNTINLGKNNTLVSKGQSNKIHVEVS